MKKTLFAVIAHLLAFNYSHAQTARVTVEIVNTKYFSGNVYLFDPNARFDPAKKGGTYIPLNAGHVGSATINIKQPGAINLDAMYALEKGKTGGNYATYAIFLTPGDDLLLKIDLNKKSNNIIATGKGSNNNQPEIFALTNIYSLYEYAMDKTPDRAIAAINKQQKLNTILLKNYIARYKPSADLIKHSEANVMYFAPASYFYLKTKNLDQSRNTGPWQKGQDSLFRTLKNISALTPKLNDAPGLSTLNSQQRGPANLNDDEALGAYNYNSLVYSFAERENERLMMEHEDKPAAFYKEVYHTSISKGKLLYTNEQKSLLREKIINKYFTGKTAEYLYVAWLKENLQRNNYRNISVVFNHFKQKYPNSKYIADFAGPINTIVQKQQNQTLNERMVFAPGNGTKLNSLKDVLALIKGKTVLVDMWGTWCSPCREAIEEHSAALEAYFKGKNVKFLYIANHDMGHEKEWKKLIAYYQMEGTHVLANDKLDKDIMAKVKGHGYPTYFIIRKDGTYNLTKTQYPINRQEMINELLAASK